MAVPSTAVTERLERVSGGIIKEQKQLSRPASRFPRREQIVPLWKHELFCDELYATAEYRCCLNLALHIRVRNR